MKNQFGATARRSSTIAVKRSRETDSFLTRLRARVFNTLLSHLGGIHIENSSDFKLLDRVVVEALARLLPERRRFYRGLADWVGYRRVSLPFDVAERESGQGKWSLWRLVEHALTATISFTSAPLGIVTVLGSIALAFGFAVGVEALIGWFPGQAISGFTTTIITLLILGSFIMISLGIIGEYIAKIYDEIKARPSYLVEDSVGVSEDGMRRAVAWTKLVLGAVRGAGKALARIEARTGDGQQPAAQGGDHDLQEQK